MAPAPVRLHHRLPLPSLTAHGANWLASKTSGPVQQRVLAVRTPLWILAVLLWLCAAFWTSRAAPEATNTFTSRPLAWVGLLLSLGGIVTIFVKRRSELAPFFGGVAFIAGQLVTTVGCLFPVVLRATGDATRSLTVSNAASGAIALKAGLFWWGPGVFLAAGYLWWVLRHFRGKVEAARDGEEG